MKRTPPNGPRPALCEAPNCPKIPTRVLGGCWFCDVHGNRDYERRPADRPAVGPYQQDACPTLVRCEETGRCWQVDYIDGSVVLIRRGSLMLQLPRINFFDRFTVVCGEQTANDAN